MEERLAAAGAAMSRVNGLLVAPSPQTFDFCQRALQEAAAELGACHAVLPGHHGNSDLLTTARQLRAEVLLAGRLLHSAADFYIGWERLLGAMSGGYTASGEPSPVVRQGTVCCQA